MARIKRVTENPETGWSDLILPQMKGYRLVCCDCGLAHDIDFEVFALVKQTAGGVFITRPLSDTEAQVGFKARRNNRSTAQLRRKRNA